jgi:hypothetical protein
MWLNYMNWKSMDECCEMNRVHYIHGEYYLNEYKWMWEHLMNKCHANR